MFINDWIQSFMEYQDRISWENSPERLELARERLQGLRDYCSGKSTVNPYKDLYTSG